MADEHNEGHDHDHAHGEWESVPLAFDPLQAYTGENNITLTNGELLQLFTTAQQYYLFCESRFDEGDRSTLLAFEARTTASAISKLAEALSNNDSEFFAVHKDKFHEVAEQFGKQFEDITEQEELARRFRDAFGEGEGE
jgi:hypothetical protein